MAFKIEINKKQWSEISFKLSEITDHLNTPHPSCFARHLLHKGEGKPLSHCVTAPLSWEPKNRRFKAVPEKEGDKRSLTEGF